MFSLALLLFGSPISWAGVTPALDPACLTLTISASESELASGAKLPVTYEIQNVCKNAVAVNREVLPGGNYKLNVIWPGGKVSQEPVIRFAYASWKTRQKMGTLAAGEKMTATENIMFNGGEYPAGDYKISAEITMFVFGKDSAATEAVHKLTSNNLSLKIK